MFRLCNGTGGGLRPTCVMQLTFGSHSSLDALLVATVLTPVSVVAIYDAALSASTRIGQVASH